MRRSSGRVPGRREVEIADPPIFRPERVYRRHLPGFQREIEDRDILRQPGRVRSARDRDDALLLHMPAQDDLRRADAEPRRWTGDRRVRKKITRASGQ